MLQRFLQISVTTWPIVERYPNKNMLAVTFDHVVCPKLSIPNLEVLPKEDIVAEASEEESTSTITCHTREMIEHREMIIKCAPDEMIEKDCLQIRPRTVLGHTAAQRICTT